MSKISSLLYEISNLPCPLACAVLEAFPEAGDETTLCEGKLTISIPDGFDPNSPPSILEAYRDPVILLLHATLDTRGDRTTLSEDGFPPEALAGFDKVAHTLVLLATARIIGCIDTYDLPNFVHNDISFSRHVDAAERISDLKGLSLKTARKAGPKILAAFNEKIDLKIPNALPGASDIQTDLCQSPILRTAKTGPSLLSMDEFFQAHISANLPVSLDCIKEQASVLASNKSAKSATAVLKAITSVLNHSGRTVLDIAWCCLLSEALLGEAIDNGWFMNRNLNAALDDYYAAHPNGIKFLG